MALSFKNSFILNYWNHFSKKRDMEKGSDQIMGITDNYMILYNFGLIKIGWANAHPTHSVLK